MSFSRMESPIPKLSRYRPVQMADAQKPDFGFRPNGRVHLNRQWASVQSTTDSRGVRISGSNAGFTMFRRSLKGTWLHTPFATFPFTSPPVRHRVPSHFNWSLLWFVLNQLSCHVWSGGGKGEIIKCRLARWCWIENVWQDTNLGPVMFKQLNDASFHDVHLSSTA